MSGKPGRSGGARAGAGRKKKPPEKKVLIKIPGDDTLKLLQDVAFGRVAATALQVRAAIAAVQYTHTKKGDGGIKDGKQDAAKKVAAGKFAPSKAPTLVFSRWPAI